MDINDLAKIIGEVSESLPALDEQTVALLQNKTVQFESVIEVFESQGLDKQSLKLISFFVEKTLLAFEQAKAEGLVL